MTYFRDHGPDIPDKTGRCASCGYQPNADHELSTLGAEPVSLTVCTNRRSCVRRWAELTNSQPGPRTLAEPGSMTDGEITQINGYASR